MSDAPETPDVEAALEVLDGLRPCCPHDGGSGDCLYKRQRNPAFQLCEVCEAFARVRDTVRALAAERDDLRAQLQEAREALERICPAEEGFTEHWDTLVELGLLVEVEPTPEFVDQWGPGTKCWSWKWRAGAQKATEEDRDA